MSEPNHTMEDLKKTIQEAREQHGEGPYIGYDVLHVPAPPEGVLSTEKSDISKPSK